MKKVFLSLLITIVSIKGYAQYYPQYPLYAEQLQMAENANYLMSKEKEKIFEGIKSEAYTYYNRGDYEGFLYHAKRALETGWDHPVFAYDRGVAYEKLHNYRKAKKEYKTAYKHGYYQAKAAYDQCKINEKEWKKAKRKK